MVTHGATVSGMTDTGDAAIDQAIAALDAIQQLPVHEHINVIEDVHRVLQDRLAESQD